MKLENLILRALEPEDIDTLFAVENDIRLWKYSNRNAPYSKQLLLNYLAAQDQDIFEARQQRLVLSTAAGIALGFVDLFDFEPMHRRAAVGLVIFEAFRNKGYGTIGLQLLSVHAKQHLDLHQLYAHISVENTESIRLFENEGFKVVGLKKDWNFYEGSFHDEYTYQKIL